MKRNYHTDNKSFILYKDWEELVLSLENDEQRGRLLKALFAFAKRGETADFTGGLEMLFLAMKNTIDRDGKKWEETCKVRAESGRKGGIAKSQNSANGSKCKQIKANLADSDSDSDSERDRESENALGGSPSGPNPDVDAVNDNTPVVKDKWGGYIDF